MMSANHMLETEQPMTTCSLSIVPDQFFPSTSFYHGRPCLSQECLHREDFYVNRRGRRVSILELQPCIFLQ